MAYFRSNRLETKCFCGLRPSVSNLEIVEIWTVTLIELYNMDCMEYMRTQPDLSFDLVIVDPPYFEVKGDFDFKWDCFSHYLKDVEKWATEIWRVLKKNGSLFWYGHAKKIAYSQMILDKYFNLENSLVWYKYDSQNKKGIENIRCFAPVTERILFYSKEVEKTGLEEIVLDVNNFKTLRYYFRDILGFIGYGSSKINKILGHRRSEHCFYWSSTQWSLPTEEAYSELIDVFNICKYCDFREYESLRQEYESLRQEYESLRQEYESLRRPFNNIMKLTDVMEFSQQAHITGLYNHPTQKPPRLSEALIRTTTKKNSRVLVPFAGSGTELVECDRVGVDAVGCEIDPKYYTLAMDRIDQESKQSCMF